MNKWSLISIAFFITSIGLLAIAVITGDAEFGLFLIIPFIIVSGPLSIIGAILFLVAILFAIIGVIGQTSNIDDSTIMPEGMNRQASAEKKYGGVVMLGPIPIAFGSDRKIATVMMVIGILLVAAIIVIMLLSA